jgi:hypothetical protein
MIISSDILFNIMRSCKGGGPNYEVDSELLGLMFRPILEATFRIPQLHVLVIDDVLMGDNIN